jgi:hypothetical protein
MVGLYTAKFPEESNLLLVTESEEKLASLSPEATSALMGTKQALLRRALENSVWATPEIEELCAMAAAIHTRAVALNVHLQQQLSASVQEVSPACDAAACAALMTSFTQAVDAARRGSGRPAESEFMANMGEAVEELEGMVVFVEESWVQERMRLLVKNWAEGSNGVKLSGVMVQVRYSAVQPPQLVFLTAFIYNIQYFLPC